MEVVGIKNMELRLLRYFLTVAKEQSFTKAAEMKPSDCINIPAEVKHWHGAAPDEWFSHLAVNDSNSANQIAHRTHHVSW